MNDHCYIIAELGNNHCGSFDMAVKLISAAHDAGADAIKFQRRHNRTLYTDALYNSPYIGDQSYGPTYGLHREALELSLPELVKLQEITRNMGMSFGCTAFDHSSLNDLTNISVDFIKIASGDLTNTPLLKSLPSHIPAIISTGGGDWEDIERAIRSIQHLRPTWLHCTASYPCKAEDLNLRCLPGLDTLLPHGHSLGISLHYNGICMAPVAYAMGARTIEMHLTLDRTLKGTDHAFSLEPRGFAKMVRDVRRTELAMGDGAKRLMDSEVAPLAKMAKSLYFTHPLRAGHQLSIGDVSARSPRGDGLPPYMLDTILGQVLTRDVEAEQLVSLDMVEVSGDRTVLSL